MDDNSAAAVRPHPASWPNDELTIANLGHATLLMNFFGVRVLSDPSLFSRVGLAFDSVFSIGPKRMTPPPLAPKELQQLDVILITHAHMDHLDLPSLKALPKNVVVIVCEKCSSVIAPLPYEDVRELRWGEETSFKGLTVRAMGARHWGRRWPPFGADYGFNSYVLEKTVAGCCLRVTAPTPIFSARLPRIRPTWLRSQSGPMIPGFGITPIRSRCGRCLGRRTRTGWCRFTGEPSDCRRSRWKNRCSA
jgi:Beta-lactamase superfamily domain